MHLHAPLAERARTVEPPPPLAARQLPDWLIGNILQCLSWCGLILSSVIGLISLFGAIETAIPSLAMLAASIMFLASIRCHDRGMMIIRALGLFSIAAFSRAVAILLFLATEVRTNNAMAAFVTWSWLAAIGILLIRFLITWGVVVRPPKHRW